MLVDFLSINLFYAIYVMFIYSATFFTPFYYLIKVIRWIFNDFALIEGKKSLSLSTNALRVGGLEQIEVKKSLSLSTNAHRVRVLEKIEVKKSLSLSTNTSTVRQFL